MLNPPELLTVPDCCLHRAVAFCGLGFRSLGFRGLGFSGPRADQALFTRSLQFYLFSAGISDS